MLSLRIRSFGCVEEARLDLGPGVNVLYGPNDLGKSTLAQAIRAALLLPSSHREGQQFVPWHRDAIPEVRLRFEAPDEPGSSAPPRTWRIHKLFGGRKGKAELEWSNDGVHFSLEQKGPGVETKLRHILGWGVLEPRGRGPRGFPSSFLTTVLLGPQAVPGSMLGHSLHDDPSDSGRERLTEALQALAQDPRFKEVLDAAQRKVDEAFTPTGKPRTGQRSPMAKVRQQIETLEARLREHQEQVNDSETVRRRLLDLEAARTEAIVARDETEQALARARAAFEQGRRRAEAASKEQRAREVLEQGRAVLAERRVWQEAAQRHLEGRPAAQAALDRTLATEHEATQQLVRAQTALRAVEEGGDAQERLARQSLETRRLELRAEHERVHARLRRVEEALELAARLEEAEERDERLGQDLAAAEREADQAEAARREADAERRLYDAALRWQRYTQAKARVDAAREAGAEAARLEAEAAERMAAIERAEAELTAAGLPEPATIQQWRALAEERRVAEARLGVGLSVVIERSAVGSIEVERDEHEPATVAVGERVEAQRRLRVRLGEDFEIAVEGGDPQARADREAVEQRWADEVAPVLERLGAPDVAAVEQRLGDAQQRRAELVQQRQQIEGQHRLVATLREREAELPALEQSLEASAKALAGLDREAVERRAGDYDEATLEQRRAHAEARVDESQHRHAQAKSRAAGLRSEQQALRVQLEGQRARLAEVRPQGDPEQERDTIFDRLAAIEGEQEAVQQDLVAHDEARSRRQAEAKAALDEAQAEADRARLATEQARRELEERKEKLAQAEGRLAQLEVQAREVDEAELLARWEAAADAVRALPPPESITTAEDLEQAEQELNARQREVGDLQTAFEQERGALKQVGGAIARERAEQTREALEAAKQRERDLELDYEAWRLLAQTLREAETAEGRHLGQALGEPVHERFASLTGGRYGPLALGRDLQAQGLEVAGDLRDVGALSEGVQDQLATILRIAIAEHLGTALVLDDHLAQTDPGRVAWFRELLMKVSERAQILVLTCRPEDYLQAEERPAAGEAVRDTGGLRAIDLSEVIRRA
ncbi:MAG: AAA family ATPase [Myxococcota bacterium]